MRGWKCREWHKQVGSSAVVALLDTQIGWPWKDQVVQTAAIDRAEMATLEISKAYEGLPVTQTEEFVSIPRRNWESMKDAIDALKAWQQKIQTECVVVNTTVRQTSCRLEKVKNECTQ